MEPTPERSMRRPALALLAGAATVALLAACGGTSPEPEPTSAAPETTAPVETSEAPVETPADEAVPLAETVWAQVLENFGGEVSSGSPLFAVTEVEDVSPGTIRVYVQQQLDDTGRDEIAQHVINMGAMDNPDLQTVVVRDASGVDSNHYR